MTEEIRIVALFGAQVVFGLERANVEALSALQGEGCRVLCVIRPEESAGMLAVRSYLDARGLAWVTAPYINYPRRGSLIHTALHSPLAFVRGQMALKRIAKSFSATHIHAMHPFYVAAFYSVLRSIKIPMVYRAGDRPILHNAFFRNVWKFVVSRTTKFVADSHYIERELLASGVSADRVTVLYSPPPKRIAPPPVEIPVESEAPGSMRFVYVGQLTAHKGVHLLIDAFHQLAGSNPQAHLLIAGRISDWSGDDWARDLRDRTKLDALTGQRVHFLGLVEDAPELIRRCHVHVAPSMFEEPYGLVVVEAKSVARPSIISRSGGMAELVEDGVDGAVLPEKTAGELARAMRAYLTQPGLADRHGDAAFSSLRKLKLDAYAKRWLEIYERASATKGDALETQDAQ